MNGGLNVQQEVVAKVNAAAERRDGILPSKRELQHEAHACIPWGEQSVAGVTEHAKRTRRRIHAAATPREVMVNRRGRRCPPM